MHKIKQVTYKDMYSSNQISNDAYQKFLTSNILPALIWYEHSLKNDSSLKRFEIIILGWNDEP